MKTLHITIATNAGHLLTTVHARRRTWGIVQRALRQEGWISRDDQLSGIRRLDGGSAYAAPGVFAVKTLDGADLTVTISNHA